MNQTFAAFCKSPLTTEEAGIIRNANYGTSVKNQITLNNKIGFAYFIILGERALLSPQNTLQLDRPKLEEQDLETLEELLALMTIKRKFHAFRERHLEKDILTTAAPVIEKLLAYQRRILKAVERSGENITESMKTLSFVFLESCEQQDVNTLEMVYFRRLGGEVRPKSEYAQNENVTELFPRKPHHIEADKIAALFNGTTSLNSEDLSEEQRAYLPPIWHDYVHARTNNDTNLGTLKTIVGFLEELRKSVQNSISPHSSIRHPAPHEPVRLGLVAKP
ncbi:MAG: hypothetical protein RBR86_03305 [Pseudobdellovibrionaceae bacterium]|jgi:hypothetical protein|nr:hypothetical protein [Pseudobdellovibrionaceae bacterium]